MQTPAARSERADSSDAVRVQHIPLSNTVQGAASLLNIGTTAIYELLQSGELKSFTLGRRRLITGESIADLIRRNQQTDYAPTCDSPNKGVGSRKGKRKRAR